MLAIKNIGTGKWEINVSTRMLGKPNKGYKRRFSGTKVGAKFY
jgi:hypothetical protein